MQNSQHPLTEADWLYAYDHLNMVTAECTALGTSGVATVYMKLLPLKSRYDSGERTRELYDAIAELQ